MLPLPKGEGRGEGEEPVRTNYYSGIAMRPEVTNSAVSCSEKDEEDS